VGDKSGLVFDHVTFTYPGASKPAVQQVSFRISPGETIAVVGENGSGKTTLAKLVLGLYAPDEGQICWDGVPLSEIAPDDRYRNLSCVFQDFQQYQLSLQDNVQISDFSQPFMAEARKVRSALKAADFSIPARCMKDGLDLMLSKEFAGTDLSRGEWQRLSIARAYYRPYQLIVLDEPTAAIDPFEEDRIYQGFRNLSQGASAMIITHRLGALKIADRVFMMKKGGIIAEGSHDALLMASPDYRILWRAQSRHWQ
jgi:ATP-binding cassette subfamily B protein